MVADEPVSILIEVYFSLALGAGENIEQFFADPKSPSWAGFA